MAFTSLKAAVKEADLRCFQVFNSAPDNPWSDRTILRSSRKHIYFMYNIIQCKICTSLLSSILIREHKDPISSIYGVDIHPLCLVTLSPSNL